MAVALVGVVGLPAKFEQREAEIGVFANRVARPSTGCVDGGAPHQAHRAMRNDRIEFVALDHADVEEAGVFAVHGVMHDAAFAVAVILRRLHQADGRIAEERDEVPEPVVLHNIVGIDDADHVRVGGGMGESEAQRAGLEAFEAVGAHEFETLAERAAMLLDRQPQRRIRRVVDHDDAFVVLIFEPGDRIERLLEHLRRLVIGRNMN